VGAGKGCQVERESDQEVAAARGSDFRDWELWPEAGLGERAQERWHRVG
jgi:hypothetical protein